MDYAPPPVPPVPPAPRQGIPVIGWVGIGCGGMFLIGFVLAVLAFSFAKRKFDEFSKNPEKTAAEMLVGMHPDLKKVSSNDAKGEMVVRTSSGEEITVSYKDLAEGRFSYKDPTGKMVTPGGGSDLSQVPAWVPRVPDVIGEPTVYHTIKDGKASGFFTANSSQSPSAVDAYFSAEAEKAFHFSKSEFSTNSGGGGETLSRSFSNDSRSIQITITGGSGKPTTARVTYEEK